MPLDQSVVDAIARLNDKYNGNNYHVTTNPGGLASDGHRVNFVPALRDVASVGAGVAEAAETVGSQAAAVAVQSAQAAQDAEAAEGFATDAETSADEAAAYAAGLNLPAVTIDDAGNALVVKPDGTGYETGPAVPADESVTFAKLAPSILATEEDAEAGTGEGLMTPLRTAQAIAEQVSPFPHVITDTKTDVFSLSVGGTWVTIPGLSVSIVPSTIESKVLFLAMISLSHSSTSQSINIRVIRDGTAVFTGDAEGSRLIGAAATGTPINRAISAIPIMFVDDPNTEGAVTYQIQMNTLNTTAYVNRPASDSDNDYNLRAPSSITVMEVSA